MNTKGDALVYSTYLGGGDYVRGRGEDFGIGIAVDRAGNAYVTGYTDSSDFPTQNPFQAALGGSSDAFVTKLSAAGDALVYSTYLGGSRNEDRRGAIVVDRDGNAYVTGSTLSSDFPTQNPFQAAKGDSYSNAFVTKLNPTGDTLIYSTYLSGIKGYETHGLGIAVDRAGNAYVTGYTDSSDFPTQNPLQASSGGSFDAFVTKLNAQGSALVYSTYIGGRLEDYGNGIAVDRTDNAYVTGDTESRDFPTQNPLQASSGGFFDAFVTKLNAQGSALVYSTYIGGSSLDGGNGIAVDRTDNAYVTGDTTSTDFPTQNPLQASSGGSFDAFVTKLNAHGSALVYSTYLGGSSDDFGARIAVDREDNAYVTGSTLSSDFPTQNPFQAALGGNQDAFVAKLNTVNERRRRGD